MSLKKLCKIKVSKEVLTEGIRPVGEIGDTESSRNSLLSSVPGPQGPRSYMIDPSYYDI